jgi:hypothetical protein
MPKNADRAEEAGQAGTRCLDRLGELFLGLADPDIHVPHIVQQLGGELAAGLPGSSRRLG